jgi:GNAT superfamily N-acetyltransferase
MKRGGAASRVLYPFLREQSPMPDHAQPGFTVRLATAADVPAVLPLVQSICDLHRAMDPERFTFRPDVLDRYAAWLPERAADSRSVFLVGEAEGRVVAYLVGTVEPEVPIYWIPESGWIHDVFVDPAFRHRGLARALVNRAVERFRDIGVSRIRLETAAPNEGARALFRACGFRPGTTEMLRMV